MTGLFAVTLGDVAVASLTFWGIAAPVLVAVRVITYRVTEAMDRHRSEPPLDEDYVLDDAWLDAPREVVQEHSWPHKVCPQGDDDPAVYPLADLGHLAAPCGRHAEAADRVSVAEVSGYHRLSGRIDGAGDTERIDSAGPLAVSGEDGAS